MVGFGVGDYFYEVVGFVVGFGVVVGYYWEFVDFYFVVFVGGFFG